MQRQTRRTFLAASGVGLVGAAAMGVKATRAAASKSDTVTLALIGCGNQGGGLTTKSLPAVAGANLAYVCDPDATRREKLQQETGAKHAVDDLRRVLDDKDVDGVLIAAPDFWHAPAALLALDAGKHVYVEKPFSQNLREGLLLRDAAHRSGLVVQHGTQSRSNPFIRTAIQALHEGIIGTVLAAKAWNVQLRDNIGHAQPSEAPPTVDYDLWVGPAEFMRFQSNRFHYNWRWWFNYGTGDMGNDGTHELDIARWGLGVNSFPSSASGSGGKYFFDDDQQYADTVSVSFEYRPADGERRLLTYEQRLWSTNYPSNVDNAVEFYGTKGRMLLSKRGKLEVLGERNKPIPFEAAPQDVTAHMKDFVDAIRTSRTPNAGADEAMASVALPHLGNIVVRSGRSVRVDPQTCAILDDPEATALVGRKYRESHWATPKELA